MRNYHPTTRNKTKIYKKKLLYLTVKYSTSLRDVAPKGGERMEKNLLDKFQEMTEKLIAQVMDEKDLQAISPELIKEIRECVHEIYN